MRCERCNERDGGVTLTEVYPDGSTQVRTFCAQCAREFGTTHASRPSFAPKETPPIAQ